MEIIEESNNVGELGNTRKYWETLCDEASIKQGVTGCKVAMGRVWKGKIHSKEYYYVGYTTLMIAP